MRVVFMGTPPFAVPSLLALCAVHDVLAVFTRPDSASGRGRALRPSAVKETASRLCLPVEQPATLRDETVQAHLRELAPDVIVVAAYGLILPRPVLDAAANGCVNVHASLLPRWRGAAPIQRAILAGDEVTGVSIMRMEEGLDTGPFCAQAKLPIDSLGAEALTELLAGLGATTLISALDLIERREAVWTEQDERLVTYAAKLGKADVLPSPEMPAALVLRRIRASGRQAPARVSVGGTSVTLVDADSAPTSLGPGSAAADSEGLLLGTSEGTVLVTRLKPEGKAEMPASDWLRGSRLTASTWQKAQ